MKRIKLILILLITIFFLSGCGPQTGDSPSAQDASGSGSAEKSADTASGAGAGGGDSAAADLPEVRDYPEAEKEMVRLMKAAGFEEVYAAMEGGEAMIRFAAEQADPDLPEVMFSFAAAAAEMDVYLDMITVQFYINDQPYAEMRVPGETYDRWDAGEIDEDSLQEEIIFNDLRDPAARLADELSYLSMELRDLQYTDEKIEADLYYWADTPEAFIEDLVLAGMYTLNVLPWADSLQFNYLWDADNSLSVELDTEVLLEVLGKEAEPELLLNTMRVQREGDFFKAVWPQEEELDVSSNVADAAGVVSLYRRDDFDTVDKNLWFVWEEKTFETVYEKIRSENGVLVIEALETDRNPFVYSKAFPIIPNSLIRVQRRVRVHYGNEYLNASFNIFQTSHGGQYPSRDSERRGLIGNQYLNFQYDPGRYPITKGLLASVPGYKESGEYIALEENVFDRWIVEELEFNTATGEAAYRIDGREFRFQGEPPTQPYFRVYMNAYGWYTGHKVEVDYLEVEVEPLG